MILCCIAVLVAMSFITAKSYPLSDFVKSEIPIEGTEEWSKLNWSSFEFAVDQHNGQLQISDYDEPSEVEFTLPNGRLIGTDHGEWGGKIIFQPKDDKAEPITIQHGNIKSIFSLNDTIYFLDGLAHLSLNRGAMYKLDTSGGKFQTTKVLSFDDAPMSCAITHDTLLIASYQNFYLIHDYKSELIVKDRFWASLYPNSIAAATSPTVFIGMRGGYAELNLVTRNLIFYKYKEI